MIDPGQIKAARGLLNLSQAELAKRAAVHVATIRRIEAAAGIRGAAETLWKIQTALEQAGVEFIPRDEYKGPGVRLKHSAGEVPRASKRRAPLGR
jgi:transcriptional regulator with XRE-family HTH domain